MFGDIVIEADMKHMKKDIKRCPKCGSSNIYRRSRQSFLSFGIKGRKVKSVEQYEDMNKRYKCQKCKKLFDNPLILGDIEEVEETKEAIKIVCF